MYPFDIVLKNITIQVEPMKLYQAQYSYYQVNYKVSHKSEESDSYRNRKHFFSSTTRDFPKKIRLHINEKWVLADLSGMYREKVGNMLNLWDWGEDDLHERFSKNIVEKMMIYLTGKKIEP